MKKLNIIKKALPLLLALALVVCSVPKTYSQIGVSAGVSINIAPPVLRVYTQPMCPGDGYIWTPGYWAYGDAGYYWVSGTWVLAPTPGFLWTPPYWGFEGGVYLFHRGYWGPHIGFYGGVNYGFGYGGHGYYGGRWEGGHFLYNTAVSRVNVNIIHNTYVDRTVVVNNVNRTSFNGPGGITERARPEEEAAAREHHVEPTAAQVKRETTARANKTHYATYNRSRTGTTVNRQAHNAPAQHRAPAQHTASHPRSTGHAPASHHK